MFPYRRATIDCEFEFVNDIEFLMGVGFLSHGGPGVWFITDLQTAESKDYIYSVACEV